VPVGDCGLVLLATRVKTVVTLPGGHDVNLVTGSAWASVPLEVCNYRCLLSAPHSQDIQAAQWSDAAQKLGRQL
jgi:hypothetical protein